MRHKLLFVLCGLFALWMAQGLSAQTLAVKNNLLYDATATPNVGIEVALGGKWTADITAGMNPFSFKGGDRKHKHWIVQPELRYWLCDKFNGHFFGVHGLAGQFNVAGWDIPIGRLSKLKNHRYEGWAAGAGLTYGYQWILSSRWSIEAALGAGYAYLDYRRYDCGHCGRKQDEGSKHYFGITKAAVSLIYIIN